MFLLSSGICDRIVISTFKFLVSVLNIHVSAGSDSNNDENDDNSASSRATRSDGVNLSVELGGGSTVASKGSLVSRDSYSLDNKVQEDGFSFRRRFSLVKVLSG